MVVCGLDMIRFLWTVAGRAARYAYKHEDLRVLPQQLIGPESGSQAADAESQSAFMVCMEVLIFQYRLYDCCV
jgi:hypothetical protein